MTLPGWPPRDWRALLALLASVAGSATLTALTAWLVWILWRGGWPERTAEVRIDILGRALLGALSIIGVVLISLGMAINRRSVKGKAFGAEFEAEGGDVDTLPPPPPTPPAA